MRLGSFVTGAVALWWSCLPGQAAAGGADQLIAACARCVMLGPRQALAGAVEQELRWVDPARPGRAVVLERVGPVPTRIETLSVRYDTTYAPCADSLGGRGDSLALATARVPVVAVQATTHQVPILEPPLDLSAAPVGLRTPAEVAAVKEELGDAAEGRHRRALAVVPLRVRDRTTERLTLADTQLDEAERRQLLWDLRRLWRAWAAGALLEMAYQGPPIESAATDQVTGEVHWAFSSQDPAATAALAGSTPVTLVRTQGQWRLSHVEELVGALLAAATQAR